jgi:hypothetical protein
VTDLERAIREELRDASRVELDRWDLVAEQRGCADLSALVSAERAHRDDEQRNEPEDESCRISEPCLTPASTSVRGT